MVLVPQTQIGQLQPTNTVPATAQYPLGPAGMAQQGLQVYRAQGCAYCHSQQVRQSGTVCEVMLNEIGTNQPALITAPGENQRHIGRSGPRTFERTAGGSHSRRAPS